MKKTLIIFIFIFLTGLFAGLFFSAGLSAENSAYLSAQLLAGFSSPSAGFFKIFFTALSSALISALIMLPAMLTKLLSPVPPLVLAYRSFSLGFCCGLLFLNAKENAFAISALKIFPPNLFFIPAFIILSSAVFTLSVSGHSPAAGQRNRYFSAGNRKSRHSSQRNNLLQIIILTAALIIAGSLTQAVCHSIAL